MSRILLLEDDLSLINGLSYAFRKQGFELDIARTIKEGEMRWTDGKYDLLVLDVSLPDGSGFDFCKKVRLTSNVPVIFLTASDEETSIIMGLDIGGELYHKAVQAGRAHFTHQRSASQGEFLSDGGHRTALQRCQRPFAAGAGFQKRGAVWCFPLHSLLVILLFVSLAAAAASIAPARRIRNMPVTAVINEL